jgi:hypothetical protein
VPSGSFGQIELDDGERFGLVVADDADIHLPAFDVLLDQDGRIEVGVQPVHPLHQLTDRVDDGAELDPDGAILAGRFDDDGKVQVV